MQLDSKNEFEQYNGTNVQDPNPPTIPPESGSLDKSKNSREVRKPAKPIDDSKIKSTETRENKDHIFPDIQQKSDTKSNEIEIQNENINSDKTQKTERKILEKTEEILSKAATQTEQQANEKVLQQIQNKDSSTEVKFKIPEKPKN